MASVSTDCAAAGGCCPACACAAGSLGVGVAAGLLGGLLWLPADGAAGLADAVDDGVDGVALGAGDEGVAAATVVPTRYSNKLPDIAQS